MFLPVLSLVLRRFLLLVLGREEVGDIMCFVLWSAASLSRFRTKKRSKPKKRKRRPKRRGKILNPRVKKKRKRRKYKKRLKEDPGLSETKKKA